MKLLVVTPTLGKSAYLTRTINSVPKDDGIVHVLVCPQGRLSDVTSIAHQINPRIICLAEPSNCRGLYQAINYALSLYIDDCDAFTYINDDDLLLPAFSKLHACWQSSCRTDVIFYGGVMYIDDDDDIIADLPVASSLTYAQSLLKFGIAPFAQQGTIIGRNVVSRIGFFASDISLLADFDYIAKSVTTNIATKFVNCTVAAFRIRQGQLSGNLDEVKRQNLTIVLGLSLGKIRFIDYVFLTVFRLCNYKSYIRRLFSRRGMRSTRIFSGK